MSTRAEIAERVTDAKCRLLRSLCMGMQVRVNDTNVRPFIFTYKGRAEAYEHDYQLLCDLLPEQFLGDDEPNE